MFFKYNKNSRALSFNDWGKELRIVVNDIVAVPNSGGVYSVLQDFYLEVLNYSKDNKDIEWIFLLSGDFVEETDNIKVITLPNIKKSWLKRLDFEFFSGSKFINSLHPDIYFSLQNVMTLGVRAKKWVYMHQPLPFQKEYKFSLLKRSERKLWIYQNLIGKVIKFTLKHTNTQIIVQTNWVKKALVSEGIAQNSRVVVKAPNNLNFTIDNKKHIDNTSFFYPATALKYKNHKILFEASKKLESMGYNFHVFCTISKDELKNLDITPVKSVSLLGIIPREKVIEFYQSSILVFPSLVETFGLPLLEAKMSNDFILSGDTDFGNEILEKYPNKAFFDPHSSDDLAVHMIQCLKGKFNIRKVSNQGVIKNSTIVELLLESIENE